MFDRTQITGESFLIKYYIDIICRKNFVKLMECRIQIQFQNSYNPWLLLSFQLAIAVPFQAVLIFVAFLTIFRLTRILLLLPCLYEFTIQSHPVSSLIFMNQSAPWCFHWYHLQKCSANISWNRWRTKVRWTLILDIVP